LTEQSRFKHRVIFLPVIVILCIMNRIHINQLGYRLNDPKKAVITVNPPNDDAGTDFSIIRVSDKAVVYSGTASEAVSDSASRDTVRIADFSRFSGFKKYQKE